MTYITLPASVNLQAALNFEINERRVNRVCSQCRAGTESHFHVLADCLILNISGGSKLTNGQNLPPKELRVDGGKFVVEYTLKAVVSGSEMNYVTYCQRGNEWYMFKDMTVEQVSLENTVQLVPATMLMYQKITSV